jgi:uncharacterized protein YlxW (UPF0749 family)
VNDNTLGVVLSVFAAIGGLTGLAAMLYVLPTYRKLNAEAKKAGAEASEVVAKGATLLLVPLQGQVVGLQGQVSNLQGQVAALETTLAQERRTSQEERLVSQETIAGLRVEIARKDRRLLEFEQHLASCNGLASEGG